MDVLNRLLKNDKTRRALTLSVLGIAFLCLGDSSPPIRPGESSFRVLPIATDETNGDEEERDETDDFSSYYDIARRMSKYLGGGRCEWTPPEKLDSSVPIQTTMLVSYPGSGKRLTWRLIEALTGDVAGDDWNHSEEGLHVTSLKTSYPHPEGDWSYGDQKKMHQSILLLRNPRYALPSFHTMRHELNFSDNFDDSHLRLNYTYTERSSVAEWENWRDHYFDMEMDRWGWVVEFWMQNGVRRGDGGALGWILRGDPGNERYYDPRCGRDIPDCRPVRVLSFEKFYDPLEGVAETSKLASAMVGLDGVGVIEEEGWPCVYHETLKKAETEPRFYNTNRDGYGPAREAKKFTHRQLYIMMTEIDRLRNQFADANYNAANRVSTNVLPDLLGILDGYYAEVAQEYYEEKALAEGRNETEGDIGPKPKYTVDDGQR